MTPIQRTLMAIALFVCLAVGTFVYFILNWDPTNAQTIGQLHHGVPVSVPEKSRGLGQSPSPALPTRITA